MPKMVPVHHFFLLLLMLMATYSYGFFLTQQPRLISVTDRGMTMKMQGNKRRRQNRELLENKNDLGGSGKEGNSGGGGGGGGVSMPRSPGMSPPGIRLSYRSSDTLGPSSDFVQSIRVRSQVEDFDFDKTEREQLNVLLLHHVPGMNKGELASVVVSLGVCSHSGKRWHNSNDGETRNLLREHIMRTSAAFSGKDAANILVALARMNWTWDDLAVSLSREPAFLTNLQRILQNPDLVEDQLVGDILYGIGALGARVDDLSTGLLQSLLAAFEKKAKRLNSYSLSSALWALAKIGVKRRDLSHSLQETIPSRLLHLCSEMSPQQSSKAVWALGTLGFEYHHDSQRVLLESFLSSIGSIKRSKMGSAVPASLTLVGMAKLGLSWHDMSPQIKEGIWEQAVRVFQSTNDRGITNAIWALGTMDVPVSSLPEEVLGSMLTGVVRAADDCSAWALCNIVWGLAKMKFEWLHLPTSFRQMLITNIVRLEADMNSLDVAILMWSLGSIDTPLDALPPTFSEALLKSILRNLEKMRPEELSKTVWGLSSAEVSWDSLPPLIQWNLNVALRRLGGHMAPQDVANCAYALAILTFDIKEPSDPAFRGAHEVMLNTIINNRESILSRRQDNPTCVLQGQELEQIRIYSHFLSTMSYVTDTKRIPREFLLAGIGMNGVAQGSRLQNRVTRGLIDGFDLATQARGEKVDVQLEISAFGGVFPVDAAVSQGSQGNYIALIEIDGPHHYRPCDGRLRRKDRMKEAMYRKALPDCTFQRVRWDDANKVGPDVLGEDIATAVLAGARARTSAPLGGFLRSVSQGIGGFFAWGLRNDDDFHQRG